MRVTYVDLGLHKEAPEIGMFIEVCKELEIEYSVYGIEADTSYFKHLQEKFADDPNVTIVNVAIGDKEGTTRLYRSEQFDGEGSSIFKTKRNVILENFIDVPMVRLSEFLKSVEFGEIAVLKWNIEGAELLMMEDLVATGAHKKFDLFCGASPDIHKVHEIAEREKEHVELMASAGIKPFLFHDHYDRNARDLMVLEMKRRLSGLISTYAKRKERQ